jgi:hypothetical protein
MVMDSNPSQLSNVQLSILESFELASNANNDREEQFWKHPQQRNSTEDGIQTIFNRLQSQNAYFSISVTFESAANVKHDKESQPLKPKLQTTSTDDGIQIDFNAVQPPNE